MNPPNPLRRANDPIATLTTLLEQRTGQCLAANREWRIETALKPLLRDNGLPSIEALAQAALRSANLGDQVVDALLNQESSFFRDAAVLDMVADAIGAMQAAAPARKLRLWSAGCSFGQEPFSLAMLLAERGGAGGGAGGDALPEIVATDVSEAALARARAGRYSHFEIQRGLPVQRMIRWFEQHDKDWVARPDLVRRVAFRRLNLVDDPLPIGRFDVILCRNVLLYLGQALRRRLLDRLATVIRPGGLLVLGAGETVIGQTEAFRPSPTYRGLYEPVLLPAVTAGACRGA